MTGIEQLHTELGERYAPKTLQTYKERAKHFFAIAGDKDSYTRKEVLGYFDQVLQNGKSQAFLDLAWYTIKAICRSKSIAFPLREGPKGDRPKVRKVAPPREIIINGENVEVTGPTPTLNEISRVIASVLENGDTRDRAFLALSTIYAMRAIEILIVEREDIRGDRIFVKTAKGGQPKWHSIPAEVLSYIKAYKYPHQDEQAVWYTFKRMRERAGLADAPVTPHGIRRWLNTWFTNRSDLNPYVWYDFARWAMRRGDMAQRYRNASSQEVDRQIFRIHPLFPLWGGQQTLGV